MKSETDRCRVMGIINVTPDSFSDGGKYFAPEEAVRRARNLADEGADILDLGGESTRPGATPLGWEEEWRRLAPVLAALAPDCPVPLSVDTYHPETAARALEAGARIVNCVCAASVPAMVALCEGRADFGLVAPAAAFPEGTSLPACVAERGYLDPMIGFGTTREEDVARLRSVAALARRAPTLVGASRKRIVKRLVGEKTPGKDLAGNLAIALWCAREGASCIRVHDVRETVQALRVIAALAPRAALRETPQEWCD